MNEKLLVEQMAGSVEGMPPVPPRAEVLALRQPSLDEIDQRVKRFLNFTGEGLNLPFRHRDRVVQNGRTLIRMPLGARAVIYHASGAMKIVTGLNPMDDIFDAPRDRDVLITIIEGVASALNVRAWVKPNESLRFERLWQIKATAEQHGNVVGPVLCRVVGAYRHFVNELPVWGPASLVIKNANDGRLDSLMYQVRETRDEVLDRVEILRPEQAARAILQQVEHLRGGSRIPLSEVARPRWLRFGYLSLPKRQAQRLLAPYYIAAIEIDGRIKATGEEPDVAQAFVFAVPATERVYLPVPDGSEALPALERRAD